MLLRGGLLNWLQCINNLFYIIFLQRLKRDCPPLHRLMLKSILKVRKSVEVPFISYESFLSIQLFLGFSENFTFLIWYCHVIWHFLNSDIKRRTVATLLHSNPSFIVWLA